VQVVLAQRQSKLGERQRKHSHYLKTLLYCGECNKKGVDVLEGLAHQVPLIGAMTTRNFEDILSTCVVSCHGHP
jgi:hypothetical protein